MIDHLQAMFARMQHRGSPFATSRRLPKAPDQPHRNQHGYLPGIRNPITVYPYGPSRSSADPYADQRRDIHAASSRLNARFQNIRNEIEGLKNFFAPKVGNLVLDDYRFWYGAREAQSVFAKCRACRFNGYDPRIRIEHKTARGCYIWLVDAYKLLHKASDCVVCGERTMRRRWGVPICTKPACEQTWMYDYIRPLPALMEALALTKGKDARLPKD